MHISCIILKVITKSWGGDQYIAGPPTKKLGGDLSPSVPMVVAPMWGRVEGAFWQIKIYDYSPGGTIMPINS